MYSEKDTYKEELMTKVEEHGKRDHHVTNIDPETRQKVESAIHKQAAQGLFPMKYGNDLQQLQHSPDWAETEIDVLCG